MAANSVEKTFEFINRMQRKLKFTKNPNITLVIGNTGSGKSTFVHYVAGDCSKLISIEPVGDESDYKIHDGLDPEIGEIQSTTVSRTLVPEMIIDEAGNVWYDCPGFGDTRSVTIELATTFLIKSVIEKAANVKIVLVVNYASVTESYDRADFDNLMRRATQLIRNIDRYKHCVSLVVSKVPPAISRGRKFIETFERARKTSAANYMSGYRSAQQNADTNQKKIQLVDALLEKTPDGDYPKMSIFWRPIDAGAFNTIDKMIGGRAKTRKSILEDTSYTEIQPNDFGFPLTSAAQLHIDNMVRQTFREISTIIINIDNHVLSALQHKIESIDSCHDRLELLELCKNSFELNSGKVKTLEDLIDQFANLIKTSNITSLNSNAEFNRIDQQTNNLKTLKMIAQTENNLSIRELIASASKTMDYLMPEHNWYSFVVHVYEFFASYAVQKKIAVYNVANLSDWGQSNKPQGLRVDANNFNEFANRFGRWRNIEITPTPTKLKTLNEIIEFTLNSPPQYECDGETMTISGNFLKSLDIKPTKCTTNRVSRINVFVLSTFFVDCDLNLNGFEGLSIFADKLIIMQPTTFNLNGFDGETQAPPETKGTAGKPGNSGKNSGSFFAISNELVNGESLTVNINGGNGAKGQDGTGSDDVEAIFTLTEHSGTSSWLWDPDTYYKRFLEAEGYDAELTDEDSEFRYWALFSIGTTKKHRFRIFPKERCGKTGQGGPGMSTKDSFPILMRNEKLFKKFRILQVDLVDTRVTICSYKLVTLEEIHQSSIRRKDHMAVKVKMLVNAKYLQLTSR